MGRSMIPIHHDWPWPSDNFNSWKFNFSCPICFIIKMHQASVYGKNQHHNSYIGGIFIQLIYSKPATKERRASRSGLVTKKITSCPSVAKQAGCGGGSSCWRTAKWKCHSNENTTYNQLNIFKKTIKLSSIWPQGSGSLKIWWLEKISTIENQLIKFLA